MYADDLCLHEVIRTAADLHRMISNLGRAFDILEAHHMRVNLDKTVTIWRLTGPLATNLHRQYVKRMPQGTFLRVPRAGGHSTYIKLVKHFQYLGTTISYHAFARQTMLARIKASDRTGQQLQPWLQVKHKVDFNTKLHLWQQCIFACLRYGILSIGVTHSTLKMFDITCLKQLRRIFREPTHLHRTTHQEFLQSHGIPDPLMLLLELNTQAAQPYAQQLDNLAPDDILHRMPMPDFQSTHHLILEVWHQQRLRHSHFGAELDSHYPCPYCDVVCHSHASLRKHLTTDHDERPGAIRQFSLADADSGVPTCARCMQTFTTKTRLEYHVQFVCTAQRKDTTDVEHRVRVQEMLQYAQQIQAMSQTLSCLPIFTPDVCFAISFVLRYKGCSCI